MRDIAVVIGLANPGITKVLVTGFLYSYTPLSYAIKVEVFTVPYIETLCTLLIPDMKLEHAWLCTRGWAYLRPISGDVGEG
jgi:hypothetical protein